MASYHYSSFLPLLYFIVVGGMMGSAYAFNPKRFNITSKIKSTYPRWSMATATWYGEPYGDGSEGGACGYQDDVELPPFSSMISAGGPSIFASGRGCGACYEVRCQRNQNSVCSGKPVTVVITDECPGCDSTHFDLSGTAFGAMAKKGKGEQLRNAGTFQIQYRRVQCHYPGKTVTFHVDAGANPYYFSALIEYGNGDGSLSNVELDEAFDNSVSWKPMQQSWGAIWKINSGSPLMGPLSIKLTSESGQTIVAKNVIPYGWQAGRTYRSVINFH